MQLDFLMIIQVLFICMKIWIGINYLQVKGIFPSSKNNSDYIMQGSHVKEIHSQNTQKHWPAQRLLPDIHKQAM